MAGHELQDPIARQFVAGLRARSANTADAYARAVRRFLEAVGKPLPEIRVGDALEYVQSLAVSELSPASVAHHISAVRSFLRFAQARGLIETTPLDVLMRPRVAITSMTHYLRQEEAEQLLAGAALVSPQAYLGCALLLLTGMRVSELAAAQWRHLFRDPRGNLGLLVVGKGNKERVVAVRPDLWSLLVEDRRRRRLGTDLDGRDRTPLVTGRGGRPYTRVSLWRLVRAATAAAGIARDVSPHWLRHTFGTLAALSDASPFQIQQDLGHARLETSQRYVHWAKGLANSSALLLPALLPRLTEDSP